MTTERAELAMASLNAHCGRDHDGRPYAVSAAIGSLEADLIVMQENWRPEGAESIARRAAVECGYPYCIELDVLRATSLYDLGVVTNREMDERGGWGLAVLSRKPLLPHDEVWLGFAPRDMGTRAAQVVEVAVDQTHTVRVANVHLTHRLAYGPGQLRRLIRALRPTGHPTVIAGDLNMCRPLIYFGQPYRPGVKGRTWPARRPFAQLDHVLHDSGIIIAKGGIGPVVGSDHLPVHAVLRLVGRPGGPRR